MTVLDSDAFKLFKGIALADRPGFLRLNQSGPVHLEIVEDPARVLVVFDCFGAFPWLACWAGISRSEKILAAILVLFAARFVFYQSALACFNSASQIADT